jgi:hypothetical protein
VLLQPRFGTPRSDGRNPALVSGAVVLVLAATTLLMSATRLFAGLP